MGCLDKKGIEIKCNSIVEKRAKELFFEIREKQRIKEAKKEKELLTIKFLNYEHK